MHRAPRPCQAAAQIPKSVFLQHLFSELTYVDTSAEQTNRIYSPSDPGNGLWLQTQNTDQLYRM